MSYVEQLREELVAAAAREQARTRPHLPLPRLRPLVLATAGLAATALVALAIAGALRSDRDAVERPVKPPAPEGRPLFDGTLFPGDRYRTRNFAFELSFVVADDKWQADETDSPNLISLARVTRGGPNTGPFPPSVLAFDRILEVHDPAVRGIDASRTPAPADLLAWFRDHPDLRVGTPEPVTIDGIRGTSVLIEPDFTRPAHNDPFCRDRGFRCTLLWPTAFFGDGTRVRLIVLPAEPYPLVITASAANARRLAALERVAAPVFDSLRIDIP